MADSPPAERIRRLEVENGQLLTHGPVAAEKVDPTRAEAAEEKKHTVQGGVASPADCPPLDSSIGP